MKLYFDNKGVIPVTILVIMAIISLIGSSFVIGFQLGKGHSFSIGLFLGIVLVLVVPNSAIIIKWFRKTKQELKHE